jgi:DNA-binding CsgD family transcriptional regulator
LKTDKLKSEIKHMNTELATNTMHILNKNEFINSIKSSLGRVVAKSTNNEVKSTIKRVMTDIEKNIKTDGDWQSFQIHFDKVHGDFTSRFKHQFPSLSPQEMKLSAYLRLNLSTKEIANLLNITVRGVEIARYRLRKKLALDRNQNLAEFILNY